MTTRSLNVKHLKLQFSCVAYRDILLQLKEQLDIKHFRLSQGVEPGIHIGIGDRGNLYFDNDERTIWISLKSRSVL